MTEAKLALEQALNAYQDEIAMQAKTLISALRKRLPGANILIYDNYNALAIGFSATEKQTGIVVSVTLYPRWVSLFFPRGSELNDPAGILKGSGKTIRHVVVEQGQQIDNPELSALIEQAVDFSNPPIPQHTSGQVILKSVSQKKRPRRP